MRSHEAGGLDLKILAFHPSLSSYGVQEVTGQRDQQYHELWTQLRLKGIALDPETMQAAIGMEKQSIYDTDSLAVKTSGVFQSS